MAISRPDAATDDTNTTVSFRLSEGQHAQLVQDAKAAGITKHLLARTLVVRALAAGDGSELATALASIEDAIGQLRNAMGRGVGAILQNVSDLDKETIRKWVFEKMLSTAPLGGKEGEASC